MSAWVTAAATIARRWVLDRKVAGAVRVRPGEGEMKCWGFLEKGNRMESTRPCSVRPAVLWPTRLAKQLEKRRGALGGRGSVRPHFPLSHFQESKAVLYHATEECGTSTRYQSNPGRVPRKGEGGDGGDGGDGSALAALNEC